MAATNKLKLFGENIAADHIWSDSDWSAHDNRKYGFKNGDAAMAEDVNTALKTNSLVAVALAGVVAEYMSSGEIGLTTALATMQTCIKTAFDNAITFTKTADTTNGDALKMTIFGQAVKQFNITNAKHAKNADTCIGNAASATALLASRMINVSDADASHTGTGAWFDGRASITIKLPAAIKATIEGNVSGTATATESKLKNLLGGSASGLGNDTASTFNSAIQVRQDTASMWSTLNPVLAEGEFGYDKTNKKLKLGDGTKHWNALPFIQRTFTHCVKVIGHELHGHSSAELKATYAITVTGKLMRFQSRASTSHTLTLTKGSVTVTITSTPAPDDPSNYQVCVPTKSQLNQLNADSSSSVTAQSTYNKTSFSCGYTNSETMTFNTSPLFLSNSEALNKTEFVSCLTDIYEKGGLFVGLLTRTGYSNIFGLLTYDNANDTMTVSISVGASSNSQTLYDITIVDTVIDS